MVVLQEATSPGATLWRITGSEPLASPTGVCSNNPWATNPATSSLRVASSKLCVTTSGTAASGGPAAHPGAVVAGCRRLEGAAFGWLGAGLVAGVWVGGEGSPVW